MAPTLTAARAENAALQFVLNVDDYRKLPIPGSDGAKLGSCFVKVTDLPAELDHFMEVNPRVPRRTKKGVLTGPVVQGILNTLGGTPEDMAIKNQGIFLLVEEAEPKDGRIRITLTDKNRHGIVNGGHTYAAIRHAAEEFEGEEADNLERAYVRLHILQGIEPEKVAEIAEGLNRNKPVDDPSLMNLRGMFLEIQHVMKGRLGEDKIAYYQNQDGPIYITEIMTIMEMFNCSRFTYNKHPYTLYRNAATVNRLFKDDSPNYDPESEKRIPGPITPMDLITPRLPDILRLADDIRAAVPKAAKEIPFNLGNMKLRPKAKERSGSKKHKGTPLHFNGQTVDHKVSNGWVLPMLAAFRANVDWDLGPCAPRPDLPPDQQPKWDGKSGHFNWLVPLDELLPMVIKEMVSVCVSAHNAKIPAEEVAAKESSFVQCYDKVLIALARMGKDISKLSS